MDANTTNKENNIQMKSIDHVDSFVFKVCNEDYNGEDLNYIISIGDKSIKSWLTGWSNTLSRIRAKIEDYIRTGYADLDIDDDAEITRITLKKDANLVHISVTPCYIGEETFETISGICNENEVITKIYYGLLYGSIFRFDDYGWGYNWQDCKMVNYNMMKSQSIEYYLRNGVYKPFCQFVIKHILVYNGEDIIRFCDESFGYHIPIKSEIRICDCSEHLLTTLDGTKIEIEDYKSIIKELPEDFDFWVISNNDEFVSPILLHRESPILCGDIFDDAEPELQEHGSDKYSFTVNPIRDACDELDFENIKLYLSHDVDHKYILDWIINSNLGGTTDEVGNATYEESEESLRNRDSKKSDIIRYILSNYRFELNEGHLAKCCWNYSPKTMDTFLEFGANPNEQELSDTRIYTVLYRSVLNTVNTCIENNEDKFGMLLEMKNSLIEHGAVDKVITKDDIKKDGSCSCKHT